MNFLVLPLQNPFLSNFLTHLCGAAHKADGMLSYAEQVLKESKRANKQLYKLQARRPTWKQAKAKKLAAAKAKAPNPAAPKSILNDSGSTADVVTPKEAELGGHNKTSLNNDVKATTMSDDSLAFTETVDMTVGNITMHNAYIGGTRSVCSTSKRCKEGWTYVQTHDHAAFIDPTDPQKHIPLIPETHGDVNLWTLPTTVTLDGECNHELQMAMRKAQAIHEELKL